MKKLGPTRKTNGFDGGNVQRVGKRFTKAKRPVVMPTIVSIVVQAMPYWPSEGGVVNQRGWRPASLESHCIDERFKRRAGLPGCSDFVDLGTLPE